ncbi:MAG: hypothetical protein IT257_10875 [Chitinophagaceae bacterium]|nr:hypothetical protein [Chitinophagaceae bacterium]
MKKYFQPLQIVLLALLMSTHQLSAQSMDNKVKKMTELLKLTTDQQSKYKTLLTNAEKEKAELISKSKSLSAPEKKQMQEQFKMNYEKQLSKILTVAQFKKLSEGAKAHKH